MDTNPSPADIFAMPPLVLPKVSLEQVLNMLRKRINKSYMPSATGEVAFNSKPQYTQHAYGHHPQMPAVWDLDATGYFVLTDQWGHTPKEAPVWAHLHIGEFQVMVNLKTDEAWVRPIGMPEPLIKWEKRSEQTLPLNPYDLQEIIDIYL